MSKYNEMRMRWVPPLVDGGRGRGNRRAPCLRRHERQRPMSPMPVVVIHEHSKDPLKVRLVQNQPPVETFRAGGARESLGNPVGLWRAKRRPNDLNSFATEHVVKMVGEF